jgi:prepilin-type N-terminal cleavage/methylation domain-containing protein
MENQNKNSGFTIIELLVVIAIMGLMATLLVASYNATRSRRNLTIAANELITNVRKTQSYALSARDVAPNLPAKYYVLQFDFSTPEEYKILALDSNYGPQPVTIETVTLPLDVVLYQENTTLEQPIGDSGSKPVTITPDCLQILFGLPFGRIYMIGSTGSHCTNEFVDTVKDPAAMAALTNSKAIVYLRNTKGVATKDGTVYANRAMEINGLSGTIIAQ